MSKNKIPFVALTLACSMANAFAQPQMYSQTPMTIQEWSNLQAEVKRAEMAGKLREQMEKNGSSTTVVAARTCNDDLAMVAVYGLGKNLRADFMYRGATVTLSPGDHADMGGWFVQELNSTRATMIKRNGKKIISKCPLYLSGGARDFTPATAYTVAPAGANVQVPPIMPASTSAPSSNLPAAASPK